MKPEENKQRQLKDVWEKKLRAARVHMRDTFIAWGAYRTLNKGANEIDNPDVYSKLLPFDRFVDAVLASLMTTILLGFCALTDDSKHVSSLRKICTSLIREFPKLPLKDIERRIIAIHKRYAKYRNELIGHVSEEWLAAAAHFDAQKFTHEDIERDLEDLNYVYKVLWTVSQGGPVPSVEDAKKMNFEFVMLFDHTEAQTRNFLSEVSERFTSPQKAAKPEVVQALLHMRGSLID
jgi:hypothetical protein